ncbi:MAG: integration host factor subunit alpha [Deltaproteobacteria bacterium]|nr:integration host factor subunit alpha [Deltaproteobacteria bacterium]
MTLTKEDMIKSIHDQIGFRQNRSGDIFESFLEIIKQSLENGEEVVISGFGKFYVNNKNARRGRNPHTGEGIMIASRKIAMFKASSVLRDKING